MALNMCQKREIQKVRMKKKLKEMVCYNLISYPIFEYLGSKNEAAFEINLFVGLLYSVLLT